MNEVKFEINNEVVELYRKYYFDKYPRRRKFPIASPIPKSLNQWMIMQRPQMNLIKQQWKEFGVWVIKHYGIDNLNIERCSLEIMYYFGTKRKADLDNYPPKFLLDSFVEAGLIVDDNYFVLSPIKIDGQYRKGNPGTMFTFLIHDSG